MASRMNLRDDITSPKKVILSQKKQSLIENLPQCKMLGGYEGAIKNIGYT